MRGLVIRNTGSWYTVLTDDGETVESKIKGNFRLKDIRSTNPVAVGDRVNIIRNQEGTAFINEIDDRRNYIVRKSPNLSKQSHTVDLLGEKIEVTSYTYNSYYDQYYVKNADRSGGTLYPGSFRVSAKTGDGMDALRDVLHDKISLFSGNSGVGKSTLLNLLIPGLNLRTAEISEAHNTGMHTTTFSEMIRIPGGGWAIDTPGVKGFGAYDMEPEEICGYFKEIFQFSHQCRFRNCTHTHEPGCAVLKAVEDHYIAQSRYNSYVSMLDDKDEAKYRQAY